MEQDEIDDLREEVELLKRRISLLEKRENSRKAFTYAKLIFKIVLVCALVFAVWKGYDYIVKKVPKLIDDRIKSIVPIRRG